MTVGYNLGAIALDDLSVIKHLSALASAGNYSTLEIPVDTEYQVPAGNKFVVGKIQAKSLVADVSFRIGYGDTIVNDSGTPPTNFIELTQPYPIVLVNGIEEINLIIEIPVGKYPCIRAVGGTALLEVEGYEQQL